MENTMRKIRAAFVGFGEVNTPREFIDKRCEAAAEMLYSRGLEVIKAPPVVDDEQGKSAEEARLALHGEQFDVLIVCIAGWIPSWAVFKVIEPFKSTPMVLWGLSGWQEGDRFITTADQAGTTALRQPMTDMGYTFKYVVNYRNEEPRVDEIVSYATAARAVNLMKEARLGMAGYRDMKLYGTMYDGVALKALLGVEIEHFELLELDQLAQGMNEDEVAKVASDVRSRWKFLKEPAAGTVENSVRLYLAIRQKVEQRNYQVFSYNDVDGIKKLMGCAPAGAMTLLHEMTPISSVPENDALGMVTQLMVRTLTGQVGAYLEFYEFMSDGALMGVPDYVPKEVIDGDITVMPNSFGDFAEGLLNVSRLKTGQVTMARLTCTDGEFALHMTLADAKKPIKWEEAGWAPPAPQLPSLEMMFDYPADEFLKNVMSQHYIISYGDNTKVMMDLCDILGIWIIQ